MSNTKSYNRKYYLTHKRELLEERRLRYRSDKGYRKDILRRCRARTVLEKAERLVTIPSVRHANREERAYSLKEMSQAIDRHHTVIFRWRYNGYMPKPIYFLTKNKGVFAESQVKLMQFVCRIPDNGGLISYNQMAQLLSAMWRKRYDNNAIVQKLKEIQHASQEGRKTKSNSKASRRVSSKRRKGCTESKTD